MRRLVAVLFLVVTAAGCRYPGAYGVPTPDQYVWLPNAQCPRTSGYTDGVAHTLCVGSGPRPEWWAWHEDAHAWDLTLGTMPADRATQEWRANCVAEYATGRPSREYGPGWYDGAAFPCSEAPQQVRDDAYLLYLIIVG